MQQLELELKTTTVRKAVQQAFNQMPTKFSGLTLCLTSRSILNRMVLDGNIMRRLRELREDGICPYKVINNAKSIYSKL